MDALQQESMKREAVKVLTALRSRFRGVVPVELPAQEGCRACKTTDRAKEPFTVSFFSRGVNGNETAIVTVATLCIDCQKKDDAREAILDRAMELYGKNAS